MKPFVANIDEGCEISGKRNAIIVEGRRSRKNSEERKEFHILGDPRWNDTRSKAWQVDQDTARQIPAVSE